MLSKTIPRPVGALRKIHLQVSVRSESKDLHFLYMLCVRARLQSCRKRIHKFLQINQRDEVALNSANLLTRYSRVAGANLLFFRPTPFTRTWPAIIEMGRATKATIDALWPFLDL
jgi:hypothetical protein